jgi:hypothetical protein
VTLRRAAVSEETLLPYRALDVTLRLIAVSEETLRLHRALAAIPRPNASKMPNGKTPKDDPKWKLYLNIRHKNESKSNRRNEKPRTFSQALELLPPRRTIVIVGTGLHNLTRQLESRTFRGPPMCGEGETPVGGGIG